MYLLLENRNDNASYKLLKKYYMYVIAWSRLSTVEIHVGLLRWDGFFLFLDFSVSAIYSSHSYIDYDLTAAPIGVTRTNSSSSSGSGSARIKDLFIKLN